MRAGSVRAVLGAGDDVALLCRTGDDSAVPVRTHTHVQRHECKAGRLCKGTAGGVRVRGWLGGGGQQCLCEESPRCACCQQSLLNGGVNALHNGVLMQEVHLHMH
jgi:hypothetical protein